MTELMLVVGESLVDIVRHPDGSEETHPGGSPANVAVALARLESSVELLTAFGRDAHGELVERHLKAAGVTFAADPRVLPRTSTAVAVLDASGSASYTFDLLGELPVPAPCRRPVHVHIGSIAAVLEPGATVATRILRELAGSVTASYDINVRPAATGTGRAVLERIEQVVGLSDVVKASEEDLAALYPQGSMASAIDRLLHLGPAAVVLTRGRDGACVYTARAAIEVPGSVVDVADTIGAGDTFCAALLDTLSRSKVLGPGGRTRLEAASEETWHHAVGRANLAAAISVSRAGANPPTAAELAARETQEGRPTALT